MISDQEEKLNGLIAELKRVSCRNNRIGLEKDMPFHRGVSHGIELAIVRLEEIIDSEIRGDLTMDVTRESALLGELRELNKEVERLTEGRDELAAKLALLESDLFEAADELLVEIPEPGTVAAKLLCANVIARHKRQELLNERGDLLDKIEQMRGLFGLIAGEHETPTSYNQAVAWVALGKGVFSVRILSSLSPISWYHDKIGHEFDVVDFETNSHNDSYSLAENYTCDRGNQQFTIARVDCVVVRRPVEKIILKGGETCPTKK